MKNPLINMIFICGLFFFAGCEQKESAPLLYEIPDYRSWKRPISVILTDDVPDHMGTYRIIFANDLAFENRMKKDRLGNTYVDMKIGSVVVKETYATMEDMEAKTPRFVTFMIKDPESPHAKNGWVYAKQFAGEETGHFMTTQYCIGCHEAANESHPYFDGNVDELFRDYLFLRIGID